MHICAYCGNEANEVDHVVPLAIDDSNPYNMDGLVACCRRCNNLKGARSKDVFLRELFTPPVFMANISPRGQMSTVIYDDFGQIAQDDN